MSKPFVDVADNEIEVGAYIVYAALWSRSATLKYGRVVKCVTAEQDKYDYAKDTSAKVEYYKIQVVSVDRSYNDKWELQGAGWGEKHDVSKVKIQTLSFLDRMLIVDKYQVPEEARKLLDAAYKVKRPR